MNTQAKQKGFTLIELMIAVLIVGVIASIAIPSYTQYVYKSRRTDGQAALLETAQKLERCYSMYNSFNHADCPVEDSLPVSSPEGFYAITGTITSSSYALTATPASGSPQENDDDCTTLTLNQLNQKGATGAHASECW